MTMKMYGKDWYLKRTLGSMYPLVTFGVEVAVGQCANRLGLKVPRVDLLSGDAVGVEIVPNAKNLYQLEGPVSLKRDEDLYDLAKLIVFDYCVGCVNIYDGENLVRDINDYPCYSERHGQNILWDGSGIWYIDYGHVFGRTLMLFSLQSKASSLSETMPQHGFGSPSFTGLFNSALSIYAPKAVKWMRDVVHEMRFFPNLWLNVDLAIKMEKLFLERLTHL